MVRRSLDFIFLITAYSIQLRDAVTNGVMSESIHSNPRDGALRTKTVVPVRLTRGLIAWVHRLGIAAPGT